MLSHRPHITNCDKVIAPNQFEHTAWQEGNVVCGIDEVGRGCLSGPVVTAAVILSPNASHHLLKDSKILNRQQREQAFAWITQNCRAYSYGVVHHRMVDRHNVWHATLIAMQKALMHTLSIAFKAPSVILVDAMPLDLQGSAHAHIPVYYFPFGEDRSVSIAAASILAKVKRDSLMHAMDALFPGYSLAQHKGYRTPEHKKILHIRPPSIIHRLRYLHPLDDEGDAANEQQTIFGDR